jgi:hypothetical protein
MLRRTQLCAALALATAAFLPFHVQAQANEPITPDVQKRVDGYKDKLVKWATNAAVLKATKDSNTSGGITGMTPAKWTELSETDSAVKAVMASPAGAYVDTLDSKEINKVVVRDKAGNLVAANTKVVLYNVAARPVFKTAITGKPWQQENVQKDVTTQIKSVQIAVPIMDGTNVIGVMHASVSAQ